jgi:hypothetical protein
VRHTSRVSHTVKQELLSTPITVRHNFGRQPRPKPYLRTVWLRIQTCTRVITQPVYSHLKRAHHNCFSEHKPPYILQRGVEPLLSQRPSHPLVTTHHRSCLSACVVLSPHLRLSHLPLSHYTVTSIENMVVTSPDILQPPVSQSPTSKWSTPDSRIVLATSWSERRYWSPKSCLVKDKLSAAV